MEGQREILLSDATITACQIVIEDAKRGIWRFRDERIMLESEKPYYW